jgi:hypothetical protein
MFMSDEAVEVETKIHALIHSEIDVFLPSGALDLMTSRDDWSDVEADYEKVVTPELASKFETTRNGNSNRQEGFLVTRNGEIGQWVELEFTSTNRDHADDLAESWGDETPPSSIDLIARAAWAATLLQHSWPQASFHVVEGSQAWGGRVSLGVFLPEGIDNRAEVIDALYQAKLPKLDIGIVKQVYGKSYEAVNDYFTTQEPPPIQTMKI